MGRETLVTDKLISKAGSGIIIGEGGAVDTVFTDTGSLLMGSAEIIGLLDGANIVVSGFLNINVGGTGIISLADGSQLLNYGTAKTQRIPVVYGDLAVAGLSKTIDYTIEGGVSVWIGTDIFVRKITDFTGGTTTSVAIEIGDETTDADGFLKSGRVDLFSGAPALAGKAAADRGAYIDTFGVYTDLTGGTKLRLTVTATGANLDQLTAGSCAIYMRYFTLPGF